MEWLTIPAYLRLIYLLTRAVLKALTLSESVFDVCVCVIYVVFGFIL